MSWLNARQKIIEGKDYTDTVDVPFGSETIEFTHTLLDEAELLEVESSLDREQMVEHSQSDMSDAQQRVQALQQKDELTDEEESELRDLMQQIQAEQGGLMDSMGEDAFDAFMDAGKKTITASEEDIDEHFDLSIDEQERRFNFVPETREEMRNAIELEMRDMIDEQPYPIKLIVGQKAYMESLSVLGDVDMDLEGNGTETE